MVEAAELVAPQGVGDTVTEDLFRNTLNAAANRNSKLLVLGILAVNSDHLFTAVSLHGELTALQGDEPAWLQAKGTAQGYCRNSFVPAGLAQDGTVEKKNGTKVLAHQATGATVRFGLPAVGALLDWSLRHEELALENIFGKTESTSDAKSPAERYRILELLLGAGNEGMSFLAIANKLGFSGPTKMSLGARLRPMRDHGLLVIESKMVDYDPRFKIIDPHFRHTGLVLEDLRPATRQVYLALQDLHARGIRELNLSEFVQAATALNTAADRLAISTIIKHALGTETAPLSSKVKLIDARVEAGQLTHVTVSKQHRQALRLLVENLDALRQGESLGDFSIRARQILNNPDACNELMRRAKACSATYEFHTEGTAGIDNRVCDLVSQMGEVSVAGLRAAVASWERPIHITTIRASLGRLIASERVVTARAERVPEQGKQVAMYMLAEPSCE